ncbi:MAG: lipid-A-disaccharide synthase [Puniceicoccales bacterium]|jgi:lipid-A-disaccharide synthase|nr:lipid-A-disaccharide synthase [Puniceicoccales bacterium]
MEKTACFLEPAINSVDLLIIAAECSGDELGAELISDCRRLRPEMAIYGIGGANMRSATPHFLFDLVEHAVMGFVEVLRHHRFFRQFIRETIDWIVRSKPRRICFIDSPALGLRIAQELTGRGISRKGGGAISLFQYVAPQVWAWKPQRRFALAHCLDSLAVLFPFEVKSFSDTELPVTYTGHPFIHSSTPSLVRYEKNGRILLLPGSRRTVVQRNFPTMLDTIGEPALRHFSGVDCLHPTEDIGTMIREEIARRSDMEFKVQLISTEGAKIHPIEAQAVLVTAGTMSLRCALEGLPGLIVYRTHPITYWLCRRMIRVPYIGIASILLGYECYPEFLQSEAKPKILAEALTQFSKAREEFAVVARELRILLNDRSRSAAEWLMDGLF